MRVANYAPRRNAIFTSFLNATNHIGGATRGSNAYQYVIGIYMMFGKVFPSLFGIVLGKLNGFSDGTVTASYQTYHEALWDAVCGRTLRSIQNT